MGPKVLVAGVTGVVGASVARCFADAGWEVHGTSRRLPKIPQSGVTYHAANLIEADSASRLAQAVGPITELAYCAVNEIPGSLVEKWTDPLQVKRNGAMFVNILDAFSSSASHLQHVSIIHGTKAYAVHIPGTQIPLPLCEDQPRIPHENFYFEHEDEVARRAKGQNWSWTVFRAPLILGGGVGSGLSSLLALGVVAAVARHQGRKLDFPGVPDGAIFEAVDADLIGRGFLWAANAPGARNQKFNIANGDVTSWRGMWPVIASANGLEVGTDVSGQSYAQAVPTIAPIWRQLVRQHDLAAPEDLAEFLGESFALTDFGVSARLTNILSTIKLRKAGFGDCENTYERIRAWYARWRDERLLPPLT